MLETIPMLKTKLSTIIFFPNVVLQVNHTHKMAVWNCWNFFPGIICWKRASFFFFLGAGVIIQCGIASFLDRALHFCLLWWRSEFKKIPTVRVMLPTRGNPTVGTKRLMYKTFALIFRFNCLHILKYLCSNNKKKCYDTL